VTEIHKVEVNLDVEDDYKVKFTPSKISSSTAIEVKEPSQKAKNKANQKEKKSNKVDSSKQI
jgi:hypothetical protein